MEWPEAGKDRLGEPAWSVFMDHESLGDSGSPDHRRDCGEELFGRRPAIVSEALILTMDGSTSVCCAASALRRRGPESE